LSSSCDEQQSSSDDDSPSSTKLDYKGCCFGIFRNKEILYVCHDLDSAMKNMVDFADEEASSLVSPSQQTFIARPSDNPYSLQIMVQQRFVVLSYQRVFAEFSVQRLRYI